MSETIWFKDPAVLFARDTWSKFVPTKDMTTAEALNSVVRFSIYFSVLLFISTTVSAYLMSIPAVMVATVLLYNLFPNGKVLESFVAQDKKAKKSHTMPTKENPFMNVLLTDIKDDPNRDEAAATNRRDVKAEIYKTFQQTSDLHMDTSDLFDMTQAMRTFNTTHTTTIPGDLDGFKKWLAKDLDHPDYSSAPPARHAKVLSEGYVAAKGSMRLPSSTAKPAGTPPSKTPIPSK
jgi:hypothetical protein